MDMGENSNEYGYVAAKKVNFTKYIVVGVVALISIIIGVVLYKRK